MTVEDFVLVRAGRLNLLGAGTLGSPPVYPDFYAEPPALPVVAFVFVEGGRLRLLGAGGLGSPDFYVELPTLPVVAFVLVETGRLRLLGAGALGFPPFCAGLYGELPMFGLLALDVNNPADYYSK